MTIVEFLEARIAEDEQTALAATDQDHEGSNLRVRIVGNEGMFVFGPHEIAPSGKFGFSEDARTKHFERHDPARVLREVAAKRAVIKAYIEADDRANAYNFHEPLLNGESNGLELAVELLASAYSDHADYQAGWG